jgi:y4mF family transcriptional regulator
MEIGKFVRQERHRQGLTQQELADKAEVGLNFVYQLEKNKPTVQLDKTNQVLRSLGFEIGALRRFDPWTASE